MEHITIEVQENTDDQQASQGYREEMTNRTEEFFSYAGLWHDREISIITLRQEAWPRQSA